MSYSYWVQQKNNTRFSTGSPLAPEDFIKDEMTRGSGLAFAWKLDDKKEWVLIYPLEKCKHEEQYISDRSTYICHECGEELGR